MGWAFAAASSPSIRYARCSQSLIEDLLADTAVPWGWGVVIVFSLDAALYVIAAWAWPLLDGSISFITSSWVVTDVDRWMSYWAGSLVETTAWTTV